MGNGRAQILGLHSSDPVLSWIGSMGLGLASGTSVVVDLIGSFGGQNRSLVDVLRDGPRLQELNPGRTGVAVVAAGEIDEEGLDRVLGVLSRSWPSVVVRSDGVRWSGATVVYRGLFPGALAPMETSPAVWQRLGQFGPAPGPGPVLPRIGSSSVRLLMDLKRPRAVSWVRSWRRVWGMPWA